MKRVLAVLLLAPLAVAQEPGPDGAGDPAKERADAISALTDAILKLQARQDVVLHAKVSHAKPEAKPGQVGQAGIVIVAGPGGRVAEPFEGLVEAWRDAEGAAVLRSHEQLPGFRMYFDGERAIKELTFEKERPGLREVEAELTALADPQRLVEHLKTLQRNPELKTAYDRMTNATVYTGPVAKEIVPPAHQGLDVPGMPAGLALKGFPHKRVLKARMTMVVRDGKFASITVMLTRNDPQAEMLQGGFKTKRVRIIQGGGGLGLEADDGKKKDEKEKTIEGVTTVYALSLTDKEPSEDARAFKRRVKKLLGR
ncbi:MAG: hypothetical protein ACYTGN_13415 [Planctomycetota bacterium]